MVAATFKLRKTMQVVAATFKLRKKILLDKNTGSEPRGYQLQKIDYFDITKKGDGEENDWKKEKKESTENLGKESQLTNKDTEKLKKEIKC